MRGVVLPADRGSSSFAGNLQVKVFLKSGQATASSLPISRPPDIGRSARVDESGIGSLCAVGDKALRGGG